MIGKLVGVVNSIKEDNVIIDVNGVGYLAFVPITLIDKLSIGSNISLFIETHVREDSITLFGFYEEDDKKLFNLLKTVQGVGPKLALAIMSLGGNEIINAILLQDSNKFQSISGVGAKVAIRVVSELKDKVRKLFGNNITSKQLTDSNVNNDLKNINIEAMAALKSLGYSDKEAESAIQYVINNNFKDNLSYNIEELIKYTLNYFSKK